MSRTEKTENILIFDDMINRLRSLVREFPDRRTGTNLSYNIEDIGMGAFPLFFTQSPSFPAFQKTMEKNKGKSNAQTLFRMNRIPFDNHIRDLADEVHPSYIFPMFSFIFNSISEAGYIDLFRSVNNNLLIAPDGTQYFSSDTIHCGNRSTTEHRNGTLTYSRSAILPVIITPCNDKVIASEPEFIIHQDGHKKQDCENAAAKRRLGNYGHKYSPPNVTVPGDDLYCKQPICEIILKEGFDFISLNQG